METNNDDEISNNEEIEYFPIDFCKIEPIEYFDEDVITNTESPTENSSPINETIPQEPPVSIQFTPTSSKKIMYQRRSLNECNVPTCRKSRKTHGVSLHIVPKANLGLVTFTNSEGRLVTMDRRRAWQTLAHLGMDEDGPEPDSRPGKICCEHFLPSEFRTGEGKRWLRTDVLPSQNLPDGPPLVTPTRLTETQMGEMERVLCEGRGANLATYDLTDSTGKLVRVFTPMTSGTPPEVGQSVLEDLEMEDCTSEETSLRELCRVCAGSSGAMVGIFGNKALLENIRKFLTINVQEDDLLPLRVCEGCVSRLESCRQLVEGCERADAELRGRLAREERRLQARRLKQAKAEAANKKKARDNNSTARLSMSEKIRRLVEANNAVTLPSNEVHTLVPVTTIPEPELRCDLCNFGSYTAKSLKTHYLSVHGLHMCLNCNTNFTSDSELKIHIDEIHVITCRYCNFRCRNATSKEIRAHVRAFHRNMLPDNITFSKVTYEDLTCRGCQMKFTRRDLIKTHYFWEHAVYACDVCLELFTSSVEQVQHTEEVHMIPCPCCPEKNYTYHRFKRHLNKQHKVQSSQTGNILKTPQQIFECEFCKKGLTSKEFVRRHYYWSHFQYTCIICLKTFKTAELEEKHFKSHGNICICCEEKFDTQDILSKHIKSQHPNFKSFSCENCGDFFEKRVELNSHRPEHELLEKFLCDECGKGFKTYNVLVQHRFTHKSESEKGKVQCTYCNKKFVFSSQLKAHLVKHTGEKVFQCKDCNVSFGRYEALRSHMISYHTTRGKEHKCNFCDSVFTSKQKMTSHVKAIHCDSCIYKCSVCSRNFSSEQEIELHVARHLDTEVLQFHQSYVKMFVLVCEHCDQVFSKRNLLKIHMRKHVKQGFCPSKLGKRKKK